MTLTPCKAQHSPSINNSYKIEVQRTSFQIEVQNNSIFLIILASQNTSTLLHPKVGVHNCLTQFIKIKILLGFSHKKCIKCD